MTSKLIYESKNFFIKSKISVLEFNEEKYLVVDPNSLIFLDGSSIDFEDEIARTGYVVFLFSFKIFYLFRLKQILILKEVVVVVEAFHQKMIF